MSVSARDREILRTLAGQLAEAVAAGSYRRTAELWRRLNTLDSVRPMVWINEICWHEMNVNDELTCRCEDPFLRGREEAMRRTLYQWRHLPADMVVDDFLPCPVAFTESDYGIRMKAVPSTQAHGARDYLSVIREESDVEKIRLPSVSAEPDETARRMELLGGLVGDLLPVRRWGIASPPRSTWDVLIEFYGIQELYEDMFDRPQLVHKAIDRMTQAVLHRHEQYEALGLLELNNVNCRVGTGGLGYTGELPAADFDGTHVRMKDCWGGQMAQIFSEVSPAMHDEFALQYELRLMERFGLNYYGCCEPLHKKVHLLHRIPRLRKVSMSPFVNWREGAEAIGRRYVYSAKPNPAVLASDRWDGERARRDLREILQATKGCHVEIILKDIHTVRNQPQRLWEWARIAMEEVRSFAG